jgi:hypothetical protein
VLTRDCSGTCSARHSSLLPLSVSLQLNRQESLGSDKQVQVSWSLNGQPLTAPATASTASATRGVQLQLVMPAASLPNAAAVTVAVQLSISGQEGSGSASLVVPLNSPPVVKGALRAEQLGSDNQFGNAAFRLSAAGIVDDDDLT